MRFTDPELGLTRARAVMDLLTKHEDRWQDSRFQRSGTVVYDAEGGGRFHADPGRVRWLDADGEIRAMDLPDGISTEAVAALLIALTNIIPVPGWS